MTVQTLNVPISFLPWQRRAEPLMGRRSVLCVHRGAGKTYYCVSKLIMAALQTRSEDGLPCKFAYIGQSILHAKQTVWSTFKSLLADFEKAGFVSFNGNDLVISFNLPNGNNNQIILSGIDNAEKNRGLHVHGLVLDEAQRCETDIWSKILRPTTTTHRAWVLIIGTPDGPRGLFFDLWNRGNDPTNKIWTTVTRTVQDTGVFTLDEIEEIRADTDAASFEQEYMCSFDAAVTNRVYYNFDPRRSLPVEDNTVPHIRPSIRDRGGELFVGLDFNVSKMVAIIGQKHADTLEVINEVVLYDTTTEEMAVALQRHYPKRRLWICPDASGNQRNTAAVNTNHEILRQHGFQLLVPPSNPRVKDRVQAVNILLQNASGQRRLFVSETCTETLNTLSYQQFNQFTAEPDKRSGMDHAGDALGYLVWQTFPINQPRYKKKALRF